MSDYHNNSNGNNHTWPNYAEGQPASNYYPISLASGQGSPYPQATHGSVYMGTSKAGENREQGWDVEARAGSFDRDTRGQDEQSGEYNVAAYEQTNHDLENHQQYTDQYINSLEPPLGYRDETGGSNDPSSSRRRARHRVRDVLNADYYMSTSNGGSSSASGASGPYSSRRHGSSRQHHHGYKINKHAGKDNRKYSKH